MLNIYTKSGIPEGSELIYNVESEFKRVISKNYDILTSDRVIRNILKKIDNARIVHGAGLHTPFGYCTIYNCSTSSKAAILVYLYRDTNKVVNITECGENAIVLLSLAPYDFNTYMSSCLPLGKSERTVRFKGKEMTLSQANKESLYERIKNSK